MSYKITSLLLVCFILLQCKDKPSFIPPNPNNSIAIDHSGTNNMIDSMKIIYNSAVFNKQSFESDKALAIMVEKVNSNQIKPEIQNFIDFALLQLQAGKLEESITTFNQIFGFSKSLNEINNNNKDLYELYAITHLRLGEVTNCVVNHNSESCLFPIKGAAIHKNKNGSNKAIEIYKKILKKYPLDYQSKWLLNLAYMTIDEYPSGVPSDLLIPPSKFRNNTKMKPFTNKASEYGIAINKLSGASIFDDFDNDGDPDLLCSSWSIDDQLEYFENDNGKMHQRTNQALLSNLYGGLNMKQADYNNDGFLDVFIIRGAWRRDVSLGIYPNSLLRNNGDGTFTDVTIECGLYHIGASQAATWMDVNNDGFIDLFVANESIPNKPNELRRCNLYINNSNGTFTDYAPNLGVDYIGYLKGVTASDYDNDGDMDIYITNLIGDNFFAHNLLKETGTLVFEERAKTTKTNEPEKAFPCWFFDYNNDGYDDLFVSAYDNFIGVGQTAAVAKSYMGIPFDSEIPRLYLNNRDNTFSNKTIEAKLNLPLHTMGCNYGDLNNDGYDDFYLGTGAPDFRTVVPNRLFINNNGNNFEDATFDANVGSIQKGHGVSLVDVDRDGDLDIYTVLGGAYSGDFFHNALYLNPGNKNSWIKIKLVGTTTNKSAIGSKVRIKYLTRDGSQHTVYKTVGSGSSFGANELQISAGLNDATEVLSIEVRWANGNIEYINYGPTPIEKLVVITEGVSSPEVKPVIPQLLIESAHHH